ncbi:GH25 family lysozyme [Mesorhizobium sp. KR2-14]|uniref:glycoside hydrolase family 25 protein n=1 Tax=Mesorhizobium sp. KR2-14 TaxID=3156610 RepID=UPI0032B36985
MAVLVALPCAPAAASDFSEPWKKPDRALVVDAYEYNAIDWEELVTDKRVVGFIGKASDGLSPPYSCTGNETEVRLCKALWKRHAVARELYQTRRSIARALGLKWGAYHLARPGNPIDQANNFIDFAEPGPDDLLAIDIEDNDPEKWMSLEDAEEFARHVQRRVGRFPVLYTNGSTARHIAENRDKYPLLSRLPLWYARYKPEIGIHFPKGNWQTYTLWQFAAQANCNAKSCPYRVPGTPIDIDVNVASMSTDELRKAWPFGALVDVPVELIASVPVPISRESALAGEVTLAYASVELAAPLAALENALHAKGQPEPEQPEEPPAQVAAAEPVTAELITISEKSFFRRIGAYFAALRQTVVAWALGQQELPAVIDPTMTGAIPSKVDRP